MHLMTCYLFVFFIAELPAKKVKKDKKKKKEKKEDDADVSVVKEEDAQNVSVCAIQFSFLLFNSSSFLLWFFTYSLK